ncbi:MAG: hypothetical protein WBD20_23260 [Pirellulaceae bacterium]
MAHSWGRGLLVLVLIGCCSISQAQTDSKSKSSKSSKKPATEKAESAKELTGRLPRYFGALVDDKQRQEIYKVQDVYRAKIEALEKELATLRDTEMAAIEKVLTATQKSKLASMRKAGDSVSGKTPTKTASVKSSKSNSTKKETASAKGVSPAKK